MFPTRYFNKRYFPDYFTVYSIGGDLGIVYVDSTSFCTLESSGSVYANKYLQSSSDLYFDNQLSSNISRFIYSDIGLEISSTLSAKNICDIASLSLVIFDNEPYVKNVIGLFSENLNQLSSDDISYLINRNIRSSADITTSSYSDLNSNISAIFNSGIIFSSNALPYTTMPIICSNDLFFDTNFFVNNIRKVNSENDFLSESINSASKISNAIFNAGIDILVLMNMFSSMSAISSSDMSIVNTSRLNLTTNIKSDIEIYFDIFSNINKDTYVSGYSIGQLENICDNKIMLYVSGSSISELSNILDSSITYGAMSISELLMYTSDSIWMQTFRRTSKSRTIDAILSKNSYVLSDRGILYRSNRISEIDNLSKSADLKKDEASKKTVYIVDRAINENENTGSVITGRPRSKSVDPAQNNKSGISKELKRNTNRRIIRVVS